jgi:hypothetical protein
LGEVLANTVPPKALLAQQRGTAYLGSVCLVRVQATFINPHGLVLKVGMWQRSVPGDLRRRLW